MVYILYSAFHMSRELVPGRLCGHKKCPFRNEEHKPYLKIGMHAPCVQCHFSIFLCGCKQPNLSTFPFSAANIDIFMFLQIFFCAFSAFSGVGGIAPERRADYGKTDILCKKRLKLC